VLHDNTVTTRYLALIDTLRVRGLVDGIGIQGHYFEFKSYAGSPNPYAYSVPTLKANLERLTATGLPVFITEFDINEASDSIQLANYRIYFPLFWENPGVKGITHWGYKQGDMWKENAYLVRSNGTERPALQWLRGYVVRPIPPVLVSPVGTTEPRNPRLVWRTSARALSYRVQVSSNSAFSSLVVDSTLADTVNQLTPLAASTTYYWRVSASNDSGPGSYSSVAVFRTGDQIQAVEESPGQPVQFALEQNYPNPFNPETTIEYSLAAGSSASPFASAVRLAVHDLLGREVALLVNERKLPGRYSVRFDGSSLSSGVYLCRLTAGEYSASRTMCLVK
ncbi:MAG TPA: endo-1,4-beta-xylanase, partial [Bacteroidota bacterium]|nr:endo-1,4-beta-xylanase [Bacteroidota bacterium]